MNQLETISLVHTARIIKSHFKVTLITIIACTIVAVSITEFLQKQYKSNAILNIQTSYFQHPLVNDLITPVNDPGELQAQRLSLLKLALNEDFIDRLGQKFGVYSLSLDDTQRAKARELLLQRIEYYSMSPTTFSISVVGSTPERSQQMTRAVLEHMQEVLVNERNSTLTRTKGAIEEHLKRLSKVLKELEKPQGYAKIDEELQAVEGTLKGLLIRFSDSHPDVIRAKRQLSTLRSQQAQNKKSGLGDSFLPTFSKASSQQVYDELIKKLNYLNVLFDMEHGSDYQSYLGIIQTPSLPIRAIFPSKRVFALFGLLIGILLSAILAVSHELSKRKVLSPTESAALLEAPWWGTLPVLEQAIDVKLLDAPQNLLPPPATI